MSGVRCFVAADLPREIRSELGDLQRRLKSRGANLRWVAPETMHLTIRFLGELSQETYGKVFRALEEPIGVAGPICLSLSGVGAFPAGARVLWAGLAGDVASLSRAALAVETRVEGAGVPQERRPFAPHLTLGRALGPSGVPRLRGILAEFASFAGSSFEVESLVLYESMLRRGGPLYTPKRTIALQ